MKQPLAGSDWVKNIIAAEDGIELIRQNLAVTTLSEREARIIQVRTEYLANDIESAKQYGGQVPISELSDLVDYTYEARSDLA